MVAMSGWIMPAPLATPVTRTLPTVRVQALARVSVVMMAVAKGAQDWAVSPASSAGRVDTMRSLGSCTPITPVEFTSTASGAQSSSCATASTVAWQAASPCGPVAALAQPELTSSAVQWPRLRARFVRDTWIGAAATRLRVNMAAATAPLAQTIRPTIRLRPTS